MYSSGVRGGIIWLGYCSGVIFNSKRGYLFAFPFLSEECGITVEDNVVKPLYKHIINTKYTSMAFIGIPFRVCNFPLFDFQVQYYMAVLRGEVTLPSHEEMDAAMSSELHQHHRLGYEDRHFHRLGLERQMNYINELSALVLCVQIQSSFHSRFLFWRLRD
nr:uncharacterized protein LOC128685584 isoform X3 [Cherax quadricarinatus]